MQSQITITKAHLVAFLISRRGYTYQAAEVELNNANFDGYMDHEQRATVEAIMGAPDFADYMDTQTV